MRVCRRMRRGRGLRGLLGIGGLRGIKWDMRGKTVRLRITRSACGT